MRLKSLITAAVTFTVLLMPVSGLFSEGDITEKDLAILEALTDAKDDAAVDRVFKENEKIITVEWLRSVLNSSSITIKEKYRYSHAFQKTAKRLSFTRGEAAAFSIRGSYYLSQNDYGNAALSFNEALKLYLDAGFIPGQANCIRSLGDLAYSISDNATAEKRYKEAIPLYKQVGNLLGEANCIFNLGEIAFLSSDYELAEMWYLEAIPLYRNVGYIIEEGNCIYRLGNIAFYKSNYTEAEKRYIEAITLFRKVGNILGEANCIKDLGRIAYNISDDVLAEKRYIEAINLYRKEGKILGEANCIQCLGDVALQSLNNSLAEKRYFEALSLYRKIGNILGEAICLMSLGDVALMRSDITLAEKRYIEALPLFYKAGSLLGEANCIRGLGQIAYYTSDYAEAEKKFSKATELYASIFDINSQVFSESRRANALINLGKYSEARTALESAVKAGLSTRSRAGTSADRMRYQESIGGSLKSTVFLLAPHDPQGALEIFERIRGRGFLESINARSALLSSGISENDIAQWDMLTEEKGKSAAFYKSLFDNKKITDAQKDSALQRVRSADKDLEEFEEKLALKYPRYRALRGSSEDTLTSSAASLKDNETAVIFIVSEKGTGAWIVAKKGSGFTCRFTDCGIEAAALSESIGTLRYTVTGKDSDRGMALEEDGPADKTGMETVKSLLSKVMLHAATESESLVIVPDGGLGLVPWEAVEWNGRPLVYSFPVSYAPALSILGLLRSAERDYSKTDRLPLAAFGGAYYDGLSAQGETVIAMLDPSARESRLTDIMTRGYRESGWDDLPGAREEAIRVSSEYYEKKGDRDAALFSGIWASENAVKTLNTGLASKNISGRSVKLDAFRIIHFSTHGEAVPDFPETSRIVLSQPEAIPEKEKGLMVKYFPAYKKEDGSLLAAEIIGLSTRADLVVLSACETGKGKVTATEGIVGLTRSWMVTGANGVVVSLWKVSDTGTMVFMAIFHNMVARGVEPKEALAETQKLLESGKWKTGEFAPDKTYTLNGREFRYADLDLSSPFYWAAFQYWGK